MVNRRSGMTLVELLLAASLSALVAFAAISLFLRSQEEVVSATRKTSFLGDLKNLNRVIVRGVSSGDSRFYGFSSRNITNPANCSGNDERLGRFLLPKADRCADLTNCPGQVSLLHIVYDKTIMPSAPVVCYMPHSKWFIIDTSDQSLGQISFFSGEELRVNDSTASNKTIHFKNESQNKSILALFSPPNATLFTVRGQLSRVDISDIKSGSLYKAEYEKYCLPHASSPLNVSALLKIPVDPLVLPLKDGALSPPHSCDRVAIANTRNSKRIFNVEIRSIGPMAGGNPLTFASVKCSALSGLALDCSLSSTEKQNSSILVENIEELKIQLGFSLHMASGEDVLELGVGPGGAACQYSPSSRCKTTQVANSYKVAGASENFSLRDFNGAQFSLGKQEIIKTMNIYIKPKEGKFETIPVTFP
jgi:type II secretory pathway pseudopilin PulG